MLRVRTNRKRGGSMYSLFKGAGGDKSAGRVAAWVWKATWTRDQSRGLWEHIPEGGTNRRGSPGAECVRHALHRVHVGAGAVVGGVALEARARLVVGGQVAAERRRVAQAL
eukprot:2637439-Pyramimonas_sp.AAC.1